MDARRHLVIRADATPLIGGGHWMRCAALGEAWRNAGRGPVSFHGDAMLDFAAARAREIGAPTHASGTPIPEGAILVCDHYAPDVRAAAAAERGASLRVLVDDVGCAVNDGFDAVWNPNAYAGPELYVGFHGTVLGGVEWIALRTGLPKWSADAVERRSLGIILGGGTPPRALASAVELVMSRAEAGTVKAVGSWVRGARASAGSERPWGQLRSAERALISSGSTVWEAALVGIPVAIVSFASNQSRIYDWAVGHGVPGVTVGPDATDAQTLADELSAAIARARPLPAIGNGAERVGDALRELALAPR